MTRNNILPRLASSVRDEASPVSDLAQQLFFALAPQVLRISHVRRAHCSKPMAGVDFGELPTIIVKLTAY
jgi:hypothetical protein